MRCAGIRGGGASWRFSFGSRGSAWSRCDGWRAHVAFPLTGTLTTNSPKPAWASRRFAMMDAYPFGGYRSGLDDRAHAIRIPPPAYQGADVGAGCRDHAEQDRAGERNDRPPRFHGCGVGTGK